MTITFGWWALPLVIAVIAWAWALWPREDETGSGMFPFGAAIIGGVRCAGALIATLLAWLIYFAARVGLS